MHNAFVRALMLDLRDSGYSHAGWARFWRVAWRRARASARVNAPLRRDWRRTVGAHAAFSGGLAISVAPLAGWPSALAVLALAVAGSTPLLAWTYLHIGVHQRTLDGTGPLPAPTTPTAPRLAPDDILARAPDSGLSRLGVAMQLTLLRGWCAAAIIAIIPLGPRGAPWLVGLLCLGLATDMLDGPYARRAQRTTHLGGMLDGMTDACFLSSALLTAVVWGALPAWLLLVPLTRFGGLFCGALYLYFRHGREVVFAHGASGKVAGVALALLLIAAAGADLAPLHALVASRILSIAWNGAGVVVVALSALALWSTIRRQPSDWRLKAS